VPKMKLSARLRDLRYGTNNGVGDITATRAMMNRAVAMWLGDMVALWCQRKTKVPHNTTRYNSAKPNLVDPKATLTHVKFTRRPMLMGSDPATLLP
jgi:hypothetical protein